jgi:hypothetical protein
MSLTPAKMKFLDMVILDRDARRVTTALGRMGVLELVKVRQEGASAQAPLPDRSPELDHCRAVVNRLQAVREKVGVREAAPNPSGSAESLDAVEQGIAGLEGRVDPLIELRTKIEAESERYQDELARFELLGSVTVPLPQLLESPFLHFATGTIKPADLEKLRATVGQNMILLSGETDGERHNIVAVTSRKNQAELRCTAQAAQLRCRGHFFACPGNAGDDHGRHAQTAGSDPQRPGTHFPGTAGDRADGGGEDRITGAQRCAGAGPR